MRAIHVFAGALLLGCGGAPPSAPTTTDTFADKAPPSPTLEALPAPAKQFVVLSAIEKPLDDDAVETALAKANMTTSVGLVDGGLDIEAPGARCTVRRAARPDDVPDARFQPELDKHALTPEDAQRLAATRVGEAIECRAGKDIPPLNAVPTAEAVAQAVATVVDGALYDPQTGRYWPRDAWKAAREARRDYDVHRSVVVLTGRPDGDRAWLATRGMVAFGRADLAMFPVPVDSLDALSQKLLVIADDVIQGDAVGDGSRITVGPTEVLLWSAASYAATLPAGAPRPDPTPRLALLDPKGHPGDPAANDALYLRLLRH